jgi:hypothetical protein
MKKVIVLASAFVLFAGLTFAQNPQTPAKTTTTKTDTKTETAAPAKDTKDSKSCDMKTAKDCPASKSCCKDKAAPKKDESKPNK